MNHNDDQHYAASDPRSDPAWRDQFDRATSAYDKAASDPTEHELATGAERVAAASRPAEENRPRYLDDAMDPEDDNQIGQDRQKQADAVSAQTDEVHRRAMASFGSPGLAHVQQPTPRKRMIGG
jgi:hypothetical protein